MPAPGWSKVALWELLPGRCRITGASSGIGKAIALGLAAQGAASVSSGASVNAGGGGAASTYSGSLRAPILADSTLDHDLEALTAQLRRDLERLDLLVHSAGAITWGRIETAPVADFDWQYRTNVRAPYVLTQALLPLLRASCGQIVFMNSSAVLAPNPEAIQYTATKHALKAVADSLRAEVNDEALRVLSVYPGRTASPMQALVHRLEGRVYHPERLLQPEDVAATVINALSLPRTAEVTDLHIRPLRKPL